MYQDRSTPRTRRGAHGSARNDLTGVAILILVTVLMTFVTGAGLFAAYLNT